MVNQPPPAPRSPTLSPSAIVNSSMISSGFHHSTRSGASISPSSCGRNRRLAFDGLVATIGGAEAAGAIVVDLVSDAGAEQPDAAKHATVAIAFVMRRTRLFLGADDAAASHR